MKVREWILFNTAINGDLNNPVKIYTSVNAKRAIAYAKMTARIPKEMLFFVGLKRGKIVDK